MITWRFCAFEGKTFTISGTEEAPGILPRMLDTLFSNLKDEEQKEKNKGWRMAIFLSFVEVYGEAFYDLFEPNKKAKLRDQEDRDGNVFIKNLSEKVITSKEEGLRLLHQGLQNRQVAETMLNHDSSRSHSVLTIKISRIMRGVDTETIMKDPRRYVKISKFFVVDLAGSERASRTQNTGARLREAANINTSLMTFRNCVETLRWNQLHPNQNQKVWNSLSDASALSSHTHSNCFPRLYLSASQSLPVSCKSSSWVRPKVK